MSGNTGLYVKNEKRRQCHLIEENNSENLNIFVSFYQSIHGGELLLEEHASATFTAKSQPSTSRALLLPLHLNLLLSPPHQHLLSSTQNRSLGISAEKGAERETLVACACVCVSVCVCVRQRFMDPVSF